VCVCCLSHLTCQYSLVHYLRLCWSQATLFHDCSRKQWTCSLFTLLSASTAFIHCLVFNGVTTQHSYLYSRAHVELSVLLISNNYEILNRSKCTFLDHCIQLTTGKWVSLQAYVNSLHIHDKGSHVHCNDSSKFSSLSWRHITWSRDVTLIMHASRVKS